MIAAELEIKRFALLREAIPSARRIALLSNHRKMIEPGLPILRAASAKAGVELVEIWVDVGDEYHQAFAALRAASADALLIVPTPELSRDAEQLAALAVEAGIPAICGFRMDATRGCLLGYGPDFAELSTAGGELCCSHPAGRNDG